MSLIEKLLSEKGKPMISHADYIYTQEKTTTEKKSSFVVKIEIAKVIKN